MFFSKIFSKQYNFECKQGKLLGECRSLSFMPYHRIYNAKHIKRKHRRQRRRCRECLVGILIPFWRNVCTSNTETSWFYWKDLIQFIRKWTTIWNWCIVKYGFRQNQVNIYNIYVLEFSPKYYFRILLHLQ